jgi:hypothetical protein
MGHLRTIGSFALKDTAIRAAICVSEERYGSRPKREADQGRLE